VVKEDKRQFHFWFGPDPVSFSPARPADIALSKRKVQENIAPD
jgi:hypothetical protein